MMRCATVGMCLALLFPVLLPAAASGQGCGLEATPIPGLGLGPGGEPPRITAISESPAGDVIYVGGTGMYDGSGRELPKVAALRDGVAEGLDGLTNSPRLLAFHDYGAGAEFYAAGSFQIDHVQTGVFAGMEQSGATWATGYRARAPDSPA